MAATPITKDNSTTGLQWRPVQRRPAPRSSYRALSGVRLTVRVTPGQATGRIGLGADVLAALNIRPKTRIVVLIAEREGGGHAMLLRRAAAGDVQTYAFPGPRRSSRAVQISFRTKLPGVPALDACDVAYEVSPAGLLIIPDAEAGAAFAAFGAEPDVKRRAA